MEGRADGAGKMEKEGKKDVKTENCRVCKIVQHQVQLWTREIEIKCSHKEREQWGRNKITALSIKTLMTIAWAGVQMSQRTTSKGPVNEEETSPREAT